MKCVFTSRNISKRRSNHKTNLNNFTKGTNLTIRFRMPQASSGLQKRLVPEFFSSSYSTPALQKAEKDNHDAELALRKTLKKIYESYDFLQKKSKQDMKYLKTSLYSINSHTGYSSHGLPPVKPRDKSIVPPLFLGRAFGMGRGGVFSLQHIPRLRRSSQQHIDWDVAQKKDTKHKFSSKRPLGQIPQTSTKKVTQLGVVGFQTLHRKPRKLRAPKLLAPVKIPHSYQSEPKSPLLNQSTVRVHWNLEPSNSQTTKRTVSSEEIREEVIVGSTS